MADTDCFLVQPNDRLAFAQEDEQGSLGYTIAQGRQFGFTQFLTLSAGAMLPQIGDTMDVISLELPNVFALAALVDEGISTQQ